MAQELGALYLPHALAWKSPHAADEWGRQYVFSARNISVDPRSGVIRRHHVEPSIINKAIKVAVRRAGLTKTICTLQQLLGSNDLATTMLDTHILQQGGQGVPSPLDDLGV